ncbi:unannotated protein [freshwater metagenome]|uniref:Unannotated protein n=1 Tax=freshwater metagenome TaxID=449393 RepID=A0A6J6GV55_9ZZZZ|nr:hypothetical protein [Actinomycetota bacterium]
MRRFICILTILFFAGTSLPAVYAENPTQITLCKDKRKFKVINERTFLSMKKNISKYAGGKYTLMGKVAYFSTEDGFLGYWVGSGSSQSVIGTKGLGAYGLGSVRTLASVVEDDFFKANVVIGNQIILEKPVFLVCSISRLKL